MKFKYQRHDGTLVAHISIPTSITAEDVVRSVAYALYACRPDSREPYSGLMRREEVEERLRLLCFTYGQSWAQDSRFDVSDTEEAQVNRLATATARRLFPELADDLH